MSATTDKIIVRNQALAAEVIAELGDLNAWAAKMREYQQLASRVRNEIGALREQYPDKWVAVGTGGVLVAGDTLAEVVSTLGAKGMRDENVIIEFLETDPPMLIL